MPWNLISPDNFWHSKLTNARSHPHPCRHKATRKPKPNRWVSYHGSLQVQVGSAVNPLAQVWANETLVFFHQFSFCKTHWCPRKTHVLDQEMALGPVCHRTNIVLLVTLDWNVHHVPKILTARKAPARCCLKCWNWESSKAFHQKYPRKPKYLTETHSVVLWNRKVNQCFRLQFLTKEEVFLQSQEMSLFFTDGQLSSQRRTKEASFSFLVRISKLQQIWCWIRCKYAVEFIKTRPLMHHTTKKCHLFQSTSFSGKTSLCNRQDLTGSKTSTSLLWAHKSEELAPDTWSKIFSLLRILSVPLAAVV